MHDLLVKPIFEPNSLSLILIFDLIGLMWLMILRQQSHAVVAVAFGFVCRPAVLGMSLL